MTSFIQPESNVLNVELFPAVGQTLPYKKPESDSWCGDGREVALLNYLYSDQRRQYLRNNPSRVIAAIDSFGRNEAWLMNVGIPKGSIVVEEIKRKKPDTMVELGGYVGYSTVLFADAMRKASHGRGDVIFYSLECDPLHAAVTLAVVKLAGLDDIVRVEIGPADQSLQKLYDDGFLDGGIDILFLDHFKPAYITDLKLCEELGLIKPGAVLAADNVLEPGNPLYLEYLKKSPEEKNRDMCDPSVRLSAADLIRPFPKRYEKLTERLYLNTKATGDPRLMYETKIHRGFFVRGKSDAIAMTYCVGLKDMI